MAVKLVWFNPGGKTYWRSRWWDAAMVVALKDIERVDGRDYFYQGSFNRGVTKSGGTHDFGGVGDCQSQGLVKRRKRAKRGVFSWPRRPSQGFSTHDHKMLMGASTGSTALKAQMRAARDGRNGLRSNGRDDSGVRDFFKPYPHWRAEVIRREKLKPNCFVDAVNKSMKFGSKIRAYNSVKLVQAALRKIYPKSGLKQSGVMGPVTTALYNRWRTAKFGAKEAIGPTTPGGLRILFADAKLNVNVKATGGV